VIPSEKVSAPRLTPTERCTQAYEQYLREARALAEATIVNYVPFISHFLKDCFGDGPVILSDLSARDVVSFVQRQVQRLHRKRAKLMTSALRSFLKYAHYRGELLLDLAAAVPVVPNWSMPSIPRAISPDQAKQLLEGIDQHTAVGLATMPFCCYWVDWDYGQAKWRFLSLMLSTGTPAPSTCVARAVCAMNFPYPLR